MDRSDAARRSISRSNRHTLSTCYTSKEVSPLEVIVRATDEDRVTAVAALLTLYRERWPERLEAIRERLRRERLSEDQEGQEAARLAVNS